MEPCVDRTVALALASLVSCATPDPTVPSLCPAADPRGYIELAVIPDANVFGRTTTALFMSAAFQRNTPPDGARRRVLRAVGHCQVTEWETVAGDSTSQLDTSCWRASAGDLLVTRDDGTQNRFRTEALDLFSRSISPGDRFTIQNTGAEVPAFTVEVRAPQPVRVSSPVPERLIELRRTEPLIVTWTPVPGQVLIEAGVPDSVELTGQCTYDGNAGVGVVPIEAMPHADGVVSVSTAEQAQVKAGAYVVTARARWWAGDWGFRHAP
jgi:hypothetical protein